METSKSTSKRRSKRTSKWNPKMCIFHLFGRGGVPPEGVPWGRSFEVVLEVGLRSLLELQNDALEVVLEVLLRSF